MCVLPLFPCLQYYFVTSLISSIHVCSSSLPLPSIITLLHPWSHPSMCVLPLFPCLQLLLCYIPDLIHPCVVFLSSSAFNYYFVICYIPDLIHPCVVFLSSPAFTYYFVTSLISSIHVWSSSLPLPSIITLLHP